MPDLEWGSSLSVIDASLNPVPVSDLDPVVFKELMAGNRRPYPPGSEVKI